MDTEDYHQLVARANAIHRKTMGQDNYIPVDKDWLDGIRKAANREIDFKVLAELLALDREDDGTGHQADAVGQAGQGDQR